VGNKDYRVTEMRGKTGIKLLDFFFNFKDFYYFCIFNKWVKTKLVYSLTSASLLPPPPLQQKSWIAASGMQERTSDPLWHCFVDLHLAHNMTKECHGSSPASEICRTPHGLGQPCRPRLHAPQSSSFIVLVVSFSFEQLGQSNCQFKCHQVMIIPKSHHKITVLSF